MTDAEYLSNLQAAVDLRRKGEYFPAFQMAMDCILHRSTESSGWHALGQIETERGHFPEALEAHTEAMRLFRAHCKPEGHEAQFQSLSLGLAYALMRQGRFAEAWPFWEAGRIGASWQPWTGSQYWDGEPLATDTCICGHNIERHTYETSGLLKPDCDDCVCKGYEETSVPESLLVQAEGGYGDLFLFMRWLPFLKQCGVKRVGLMLWAAAETVFDWKVFGVDEVYVIDRDCIPFDWTHSVSIMSLPAVLNMATWEEIPRCGAGGRIRIGKAPRIGFCWRAEESASPIKLRSLPWEVASCIAGEFQPDFYSLSPSEAGLYEKNQFSQPRYTNYQPERMTDWEATRDYILSMDFVVTVDTAVAHLAGLLGIPALVLLPIGSDWKWGMPGILPYRQITYWYGPQLSIYRQKEPLVWDAVEIVAAVRERIA